MSVSAKTRKNLRVIASFVLVGTLTGVTLSSWSAGGMTTHTIVGGGSIGFAITALCVYGNFSLLPRYRRLPFTVYLLVKTLYFTAVAALFLSVRFFLLGPFLGEVPHKLKTFGLASLLTLAISLLANLVFVMRRILGQKTFYNLVTGRYHTPVEEERLIMFLDVSSSTTIAERIGHKRFHAFLNKLFHEITEPVLSAGGEIYKYVGDEVIVTWRGASAAENLRCVKSYFDIVDKLYEHRQEYLRQFDFVPHLRAGMHRGTVTVGELGDFKREIALIGDTMNTTARIREACKYYQQDLIVSSELMKELPSPLPYHIEILGEIQLRGKEKAVELYGFERLQGRR